MPKRDPSLRRRSRARGGGGWMMALSSGEDRGGRGEESFDVESLDEIENVGTLLC